MEVILYAKNPYQHHFHIVFHLVGTLCIETMDNGWIILHRKILSWGWYDDPNTKSLFLHFILMANHEPREWHGVRIARGQLIVGRAKLSKILGISQKTIRTSIKRLKSTNEVATQTTNRYTLITVVKYEQYQNKEEGTASKTASKTASYRPATGHKQQLNNVNNTLRPSSAEKNFDLLAYVTAMVENKARHIRIIGLYYRQRKISFPSLKAIQADIRRWVRDATLIAEYDDEAFNAAFRYVSRKFPEEWHLGTIAKYISNPIIHTQ